MLHLTITIVGILMLVFLGNCVREQLDKLVSTVDTVTITKASLRSLIPMAIASVLVILALSYHLIFNQEQTMITYLFLVSVFIIICSPVFFIGYLIETKQEKQRSQLRDEIAKSNK